jgi:DNA invertase Pin-like site-specific DNA recombinase
VLVDAYIRVSKVAGREGESFQSPGEQERAIREAVKRQGWSIAEVNTEDLDRSGSSAQRPGFQRVLNRIETKQIDGIAVIRADRFARSVKVAWEAIERIKEAGGVFLSATENIDVNSPMGKTITTFIFAMAEYKIDQARVEFASARGNALERNVSACVAPFGYTREKHERLVVDRSLAKKIVRGFEARAAGKSWAQVRDIIGSNSISHAKRVVENPVYLGHLVTKYGTKHNAHEAIVTRALWEKAQIKHPRPKRGTKPSLLTGLIFCAGCGGALTPQHSPKTTYRCKGEKCGSRTTILQRYVDPFVVDAFFEKIGTKEYAVRARKSGRDEKRAMAELEAAEAELQATIEAISGLVTPAQLKAGVKSKTLAVDAAREALRKAHGGKGLPDLGTLRQLWPSLAVDEQRHVLRGAIQGVFVIRGSLPVEERVDHPLR